MKSDMSELKTRLLNPYDGAIVEIRKNTEFRHDWEKQEKDMIKLQDEHRDLVRRQATYTKIFWTMFTTTVGVLAYIVTNILNK